MDSLETRLFAKRRITKTGCWEWTGKRQGSGYGEIWMGGPGQGNRTAGYRGRSRRVHRVAAMLWLNMDLESDVCVLHRCDNPPCFNPDHLFLGDRADNNADRGRKKRGREAYQQGAENPNSALTEDDVREIVRRVEAGETQQAVADAYGVRQGHVSRIVSRKAWRHIW